MELWKDSSSWWFEQVGSGVMHERKTLLGASAAGAFGGFGGESVFMGLAAGGEIGRWRIGADVEAGAVHPAFQSGMFTNFSTLATSAIALRAKRRSEGEGTLQIAVSQPLRVERGQASFDVPIRRTPEGQVLRSLFTSDAKPSGRQIDLAAEWHKPIAVGTLRLGAALSRYPGPVTITLLTRAGFCGMHDACRLACDSFARKRFRGLRARSGREARAGARLRASCALAQSGATRGASRAFRRRGRSCRGWRRSWG